MPALSRPYPLCHRQMGGLLFNGGGGGLSPTWGNSLAFLHNGIDEYSKYGAILSKERTAPVTWVTILKRNGGGLFSGKFDGSLGRGYYQYLSGATLQIGFRNTATTNDLAAIFSGIVTAGVWYQLIVSYPGTSNANDVLVWLTPIGTPGARLLQTASSTINTLSATIINSAEYAIGAEADGSLPFDGRIAEHAVFGVAFNQTDANATVDGSGNPIDLRTHSKAAGAGLEFYDWCGDGGDSVQVANGISSHLLASNLAIGTGVNMDNATNIVAFP